MDHSNRDTLDLLVIGAYKGKGKRSNMIGSFLIGCYYDNNIIPISKVGTGFSED